METFSTEFIDLSMVDHLVMEMGEMARPGKQVHRFR
jgi:hypothetical protein